MCFRPRQLAPLALLLATLASARAQELSFWGLTPYRVRVVVAVDTQSAAPEAFAHHLAERLAERTDAAIGALWRLETVVADPRLRTALISAPEGELGAVLPDREDEEKESAEDEASEGEQEDGEHRARPDKTIVIGVVETVRGVRVWAVEHDEHVRRWGARISEPVAALSHAPETAFRLMCEAFAPVANFDVDAQDVEHVTLSFKGAELPKRDGAPNWTRAGDVYEPILRRIDREGQPVENGVQPVPWTYFLLTEPGDPATADVYSHTRRPLGARRRGRVEYLAVRVPQSREATTLRLHAREDASRPLIGYQVFVQDGPEAEREPIGATDAQGTIPIAPGEWPIQLAYVKCGGQVVAKLPVAPGAEQRLDVPLLDETPRLNVEAKLGLLREELIDVVARRQILIARIDGAIDQGDLDKAVRLQRELEQLPGMRQFRSRIRSQRQSVRTDNPSVQQRIDQMFADTERVLNAFLGQREITEVQMRIADARKAPEG